MEAYRYYEDAIADMNKQIDRMHAKYSEEDDYASNDDELEGLEVNDSATLYFNNGEASVTFDYISIH